VPTIVPVHPGDGSIEPLLQALRVSYLNGGVLLGCFSLGEEGKVQWFMDRTPGRLYTLDPLLLSPAFRTAMPDLMLGDSYRYDPKFVGYRSIVVECELADLVNRGGAYGHFGGTPREAKRLSQAFCDTVIGERFDEFFVFKSNEPWSRWFKGQAWDETWVLADLGEGRAWSLCVTDTD
jgi:hypothetical protein